MRSSLISALVWGCAVILPVRAGEAAAPQATYVRTHRFPVSIPVERSDVLTSSKVDLFASKSPTDGWTVEGMCILVSLPDGVCYQRDVTVPYDGVFFFRLGLLDDKGNRTPPAPGTPAQTKVVVDTVAPLVDIATPQEDTRFAPKEPVRITWRVTDPNLAERPISVAYVLDGEKTQNFIVRNVENTGAVTWNAPDIPNTRVQIAIMAEDLSGNVALAQRGVVIGSTAPYREETVHTPSKPALIAFTMAGNLVRQQAPKDALRYYHMALEHDPDFTDAMNDAALVYRHLGEYGKAQSLMRRAVDRRSRDPYLYQNLADIEQSWGLSLLQDHQLDEGMGHIKEAIKYYAHAIDLSEQQNTVCERGASFFRLGEISYYVNGDVAGARQYWRKVIDLHAPTPDITEAPTIYHRHTSMKQALRTWQMWAREHLRMLDNYERAELAVTAPSTARLQPHASVPAENSPQANRQMYRTEQIDPAAAPFDERAIVGETTPPPAEVRSPARSRSFLPWNRR